MGNPRKNFDVYRTKFDAKSLATAAYPPPAITAGELMISSVGVPPNNVNTVGDVGAWSLLDWGKYQETLDFSLYFSRDQYTGFTALRDLYIHVSLSVSFDCTLMAAGDEVAASIMLNDPDDAYASNKSYLDIGQTLSIPSDFSNYSDTTNFVRVSAASNLWVTSGQVLNVGARQATTDGNEGSISVSGSDVDPYGARLGVIVLNTQIVSDVWEGGGGE